MSPAVTSGVIAVAAFAGTILLSQTAAASFRAYRQRFTDDARRRLEEAFLFVDPNRLFVLSLLSTVVVPPLLWFLTASPILPVLAGVLALVLPRIAFTMISRRRRLKIVLQLPDVLLMLASSLRAGTSLQIAMDITIRETPAPLSQEASG